MQSHHAHLLLVANPDTYELPPAADNSERKVLRVALVGIDTVRELVQTAHRRPANDAEFLEVVLVANKITLEAEQALLKVTEEPPSSTRFIFIFPQGTALLPTLRSRFQISTETEYSATEAFTEFQQATITVRLALIEAAQTKKDTEWQAAIKSGLLAFLATKTIVADEHDLATLQLVSTTLGTRGAMNKWLLEALAFAL